MSCIAVSVEVINLEGGVHDLGMDGGLPTGYQKGTLI